MPSRGRLLAFLGLVPLGAFVVVHLVTTATALSGGARFDHVFARNAALTAATLVVVPGDALYEVTEAHLSSTWHSLPVVALAYLAGTAATLYHLGSSTWATFRGSGALLREKATASVKWSVVLGVAGLFVLAMNTIVYMATGTRLIGREPTHVPDGPPAAACTPKS